MKRVHVVIGVAATLVVVAGVCVGVALHGQQSPPQPSKAALAPTSAHSSAPTPGAPRSSPSTGPSAPTPPLGGTPGQSLPYSQPVSIDIPNIGVHSTLLSLGLNKDRTIQVPPNGRISRAGWYRYSPSPGQLGPATVIGHVDSASYGPGIFFKLGALKPGSSVDVRRSDGRVVVFTVQRLAVYPKDKFPTFDVYGNLSYAGLRLITCGGGFDSKTGHYVNNIVVFAKLAKVEQTS